MAAGSVSIGPDTKIGDLISYLRDGGDGTTQGAPAAQPNGAATAATPAPAVPPAAPPTPPPPTPAQAGYAAFIADPQNATRAAHAATPAGQSIAPNMASVQPMGVSGPPSMGAPAQPNVSPAFGNVATMAPSTPPQMGAPAQPNVAPRLDTQEEWAAKNPKMLATPMLGKGAGTLENVLQLAAAGLTGAAGGMKGDPGAGLRYVQQLNDYDNTIPEVNNARYRAAVVQPALDAQKTAQANAQLADTQSQTTQRQAQAKAYSDRQISQAAKLGMVLSFDDNGNLQGYEVDPNSPITKSRQQKDSLVSAQVDDTKAQSELRAAQAAVENAKNDPNSPAYRQAQARIAVAQQNASTARQRLALSTQQYMAHAYGVGGDGQALPGAQLLPDGTPVGTWNAKNVAPTAQEINKGDMANSAAEQLATIKDIMQKNPTMFGPGYGQSTEFKKWVGSQSPDAQRFLAARTIAGDHLAGTFGGRSEAALTALDNAIGQFKDNPKAALAGVDQLSSANSRFQQAGTRHVAGGAGLAKAPGGPKEGDMKTNSAGDKVRFSNGKWGPA